MKTVLFMTATLEHGGVERLLVDTAKRLSKSGEYQPFVCCLFKGGALMHELQNAGISSVALNIENLRDIWKNTIRIREVIKLVRPDIIHTNQFASDFYAALASYGCPAPLISHIHNPLAEKISRRVIRRIFGYFAIAAFVVTTETMATKLSWIQKKKLFILHNAINPENLKLPEGFDPKLFKKKLVIPANNTVIGTVGRLAWEKGYDILLPAFQKVHKKYPETSLLIIGDGPEEKRLKKLSEDLEISQHVIFTGYRNDIEKFLAIFDIMVISSRTESFSLTAIEAMFSGIPLVITDRLSTKKIFASAAIVVALSPDDLYGGIALLINNYSGERLALGKQGKLLANREFSIDKYVSGLTRIYNQILSANR